MISEGDYFYRGAVRISWGFSTPNYLGAFLAGFMPLVWAVTTFCKRPLPRAQPKVPAAEPSNVKGAATLEPFLPWALIGLLAAELFLWGALGATASRGAAVAAMSGALFWELFRHYQEGRTWQRSLRWICLRAAFCIVGFAVFSFGGRLAPGYLAQDASIGNRWLLWAGGAALCHSSPWSGWGSGESGHLFTQWVQPLDRPQEYKTMVNSYLHLAVEHGLPALGAVLAVVGSLVGWPLLARRTALSYKWAGVGRAAACIWITWAVANIFSTLFDDWRMWYAPGIAVLLLVSSLPGVWKARQGAGRWIGGVAIVALGMPTAIYLTGALYQRRSSIQIGRSPAGMVLLSRGAGNGAAPWGILPDTSVLGGKYGHEIRRWGLATKDQEWSAWIFDPRRGDLRDRSGDKPDHWLVFGANAARVDYLRDTDFAVIVHPRGTPPLHWAGKGLVLLNRIDEDGSAAAWINWAESRGLRHDTIPDIGIDARAAWPGAYIEQLEGAGQ
jgi:hypothetical protein